jgi:hypothetical protein
LSFVRELQTLISMYHNKRLLTRIYKNNIIKLTLIIEKIRINNNLLLQHLKIRQMRSRQGQITMSPLIQLQFVEGILGQKLPLHHTIDIKRPCVCSMSLGQQQGR